MNIIQRRKIAIFDSGLKKRQSNASRILGTEKFYVSISDQVTRTILSEIVNDYDSLRLFLDKISSERWSQVGVVIDVGAHYGGYSRIFSQEFFQVHAIEANSETFGILAENLKSAKNVFVHNFAVGREESEKEMYSISYATERSTLRRPKDLNSMSEKYCLSHVRTRRLDCFLREIKASNVELIKIDIEGYETEALLGLEGFLLKLSDKELKPAILIEFVEDIVKIRSTLIGLGYTEFFTTTDAIIKCSSSRREKFMKLLELGGAKLLLTSLFRNVMVDIDINHFLHPVPMLLCKITESDK
jgi:FkbM family methyltransferase